MILNLILGLAGTIIGVIIGGNILFVGRRALSITLALMAFATSANLLAILVADVANGWELIDTDLWWLLGIAVAIGLVGFFLGRTRSDIAVPVIGFIAGAEVAIWFFEIADHLIVNVYDQSEQTALWVGLGILIIGGLFGVWLVRVSRDEALILITMVVGARIIQSALGLSRTSSWTAILILTLALAGVMVQFTLYLREVKGEQTELEPFTSSVAYFQDLELH